MTMCLPRIYVRSSPKAMVLWTWTFTSTVISRSRLIVRTCRFPYPKVFPCLGAQVWRSPRCDDAFTAEYLRLVLCPAVRVFVLADEAVGLAHGVVARRKRAGDRFAFVAVSALAVHHFPSFSAIFFSAPDGVAAAA